MATEAAAFPLALRLLSYTLRGIFLRYTLGGIYFSEDCVFLRGGGDFFDFSEPPISLGGVYFPDGSTRVAAFDHGRYAWRRDRDHRRTVRAGAQLRGESICEG